MEKIKFMYMEGELMISIVTGCFNEQGNIKKWYEKVKAEVEKTDYDYEIIVIDNCSADGTVSILKELAQENKKLKLILNSRNFGPLRSPFYAMQQAQGNAMIYLACDLQDPPELIPSLIQKWEDGYKIVVCQKKASEESKIKWYIRKLFYKINALIEDEDKQTLKDYTGYGLYDKLIIDQIKKCQDPKPYIKSFITEVGFDIAIIEYKQNKREYGKSNFSLHNLIGYAFEVITKSSVFPIRFMTYIGCLLSITSMTIAILYFAYKIVNWQEFELGMAPVIIGLFFFASVQLFFLGIIGEYLLAIYNRVNIKPLVVEKERVNF